MIEDITIMIPAYNPDNKFIEFVSDLTENGYKIIIIDDGSRDDTKRYFDMARDQYGCRVVSHSINLGQGRAYKTGFNYYLSESKWGGQFSDSIGVIQCDCDGQHCVEDINRCTKLLRSNPDKFILGVRDFSDKDIPLRSRFGNNSTSIVFKLFCGLNLKDTQTGLKGIPKSFIPCLMETPGERFEYASSVLLETKRKGVEILQFPIRTIYINENETSHFSPMRDSIRIYSLILKYLASSLSAFLVDIIAFSFFLSAAKGLFIHNYIIISAYLSKIISCTYTYVVNKNLGFKRKNGNIWAIAKYTALYIGQATASGFLTYTLVSVMNLNEVISKIIADIFLFFVSFRIQDR